MKKILLFLLLSTSIFAQTGLYSGVGVGYYSENYVDGVSAKSSAPFANFKIGYGNINSYAIEFVFDYIDNTSSIFSPNDSAKQGLNINLVKSLKNFDTIKPFLKVGFGIGFMSIDGQFQEKLNYGSFNLGAGVFIPLNKTFDIEIAYEYRSVSYEGIDMIAEQRSYKSNVNMPYIGINTRF